jgi:hypothetical protein
LDKIFRFGKQGGLPKRLCPTLVGLREEVMEGAYTLVLEFEAKMEEGQWQERQPKIQSFFGPGEMLGGALDVAMCVGPGEVEGVLTGALSDAGGYDTVSVALADHYCGVAKEYGKGNGRGVGCGDFHLHCYRLPLCMAMAYGQCKQGAQL